MGTIEDKSRKCHACGGDQFSSDCLEDSLIDAPDDTKLKCAYCGAETTKAGLIADNSHRINASIGDITADVTTELKKELGTRPGRPLDD